MCVCVLLDGVSLVECGLPVWVVCVTHTLWCPVCFVVVVTQAIRALRLSSCLPRLFVLPSPLPSVAPPLPSPPVFLCWSRPFVLPVPLPLTVCTPTPPCMYNRWACTPRVFAVVILPCRRCVCWCGGNGFVRLLNDDGCLGVICLASTAHTIPVCESHGCGAL